MFFKKNKKTVSEKYKLIDDKGGVIDTFETTSFKKASEYFKNKHSNGYIITCEKAK